MMTQPKLVDGSQLLNELFDEPSRPSIRWLRLRQQDRSVPHVKIGRLIFFDVPSVRAALEKRTLKAR